MGSQSKKLLDRISRLAAGSLIVFTVLVVTVPEGSCGVLTAARGFSTTKDGRKVQTGVWGGDHIIIEVGDTNATVMFECADGTIDEPLVIDDSGRFDVSGVFMRRTGGPARSDQKPERLRVRYAGSVKGTSMSLTVTLRDTNKTEGTYFLRYNERPELRRCL